MKLLKTAAVSAALVVAGASAQAAVMDFDINVNPDIGSVEGNPITVGGVNVTVTSSTGCAYWDTDQASNNGMGAYDNGSCTGNDNFEQSEILTFTFEKMTTLLGFTVNGDHVPFGDGSMLVNGENVTITGGAGTPTGAASLVWTFTGLTGGSTPNTGYISSLTVSQIPLPAAGWLLIAGLGGLGAMRRKKA